MPPKDPSAPNSQESAASRAAKRVAKDLVESKAKTPAAASAVQAQAGSAINEADLQSPAARGAKIVGLSTQPEAPQSPAAAAAIRQQMAPGAVQIAESGGRKNAAAAAVRAQLGISKPEAHSDTWLPYFWLRKKDFEDWYQPFPQACLNQLPLAKIAVYPDIEWQANLHINSGSLMVFLLHEDTSELKSASLSNVWTGATKDYNEMEDIGTSLGDNKVIMTYRGASYDVTRAFYRHIRTISPALGFLIKVWAFIDKVYSYFRTNNEEQGVDVAADVRGGTGVSLPNVTLTYNARFKEKPNSWKVGTEWSFQLLCDPLIGIYCSWDILGTIITVALPGLSLIINQVRKHSIGSEKLGVLLENEISIKLKGNGKISGAFAMDKDVDDKYKYPKGQLNKTFLKGKIEFAIEAVARTKGALIRIAWDAGVLAGGKCAFEGSGSFSIDGYENLCLQMKSQFNGLVIYWVRWASGSLRTTSLKGKKTFESMQEKLGKAVDKGVDEAFAYDKGVGEGTVVPAKGKRAKIETTDGISAKFLLEPETLCDGKAEVVHYAKPEVRPAGLGDSQPSAGTSKPGDTQVPCPYKTQCEVSQLTLTCRHRDKYKLVIKFRPKTPF